MTGLDAAEFPMRYLTSYRFLILAKIGLCIAYLWICWDFVRINLALGDHLQKLLPGLGVETICDSLDLNDAIIAVLGFLSAPASIWIYSLAAPVAVGLFLWGRHRWLQVGVALWVWLSIIGLTARATILMSTADFWLCWSFILYAVAGLVTPKGRWEQSQPPLTRALWRENPIVASEYALMLTVLQFCVYFYAGVNKLLDGWQPWTTGVAIQNLSNDLSMHDFARGIPVPYWISLILCYVTLFQRLVVPFGFFSMRYRGWAVLILAAMHIGYEILMQVAIFPLVGISGLLVIVPPRALAQPLFSKPSLKMPKVVRSYLRSLPAVTHSMPQKALLGAALTILLIEPIYCESAGTKHSYWNIKMATLLHWVMFSDGGVFSNTRLKVGVRATDAATGETHLDEVTYLPYSYLPVTWRTRFYEQTIFFRAWEMKHSGGQPASDAYLGPYVTAATDIYHAEPHEPHAAENVVVAFVPYKQAAASDSRAKDGAVLQSTGLSH